VSGFLLYVRLFRRGTLLELAVGLGALFRNLVNGNAHSRIATQQFAKIPSA
jgi:hypothetical protein